MQKGDASRGLIEQRQVRGGQEWGLRHRNAGPGGEQVRKGEELKQLYFFSGFNSGPLYHLRVVEQKLSFF